MCWCFCVLVFFFKQKTAYEMRISDWSSDVCSSDLALDKGFDGRLGIGHAVTRRVWRSLEGSGPVAGRRRRGRGRRSTVAFNYTWPFPDLVKIRPGRPLEQIRVGFMLSDLAGC